MDVRTDTDPIIKTELSAVPSSERAPKLSPTQAGLTSDTRDPLHQCRTCVMFITDGRCGQVGSQRGAAAVGEIKPHGTCNFWRFGRPMAPEKAVELAVKVGKAEAGYMEREGGFQCGGCDRYSADGRRCGVTYGFYAGEGKGDIRPDWCCSLWTDGEPWVPKGE